MAFPTVNNTFSVPPLMMQKIVMAAYNVTNDKVKENDAIFDI